MIAPMKKYSFLIYHKEYIEFLNRLQELGILHVIEKESGELEDEHLREQYHQVSQLNAAIKSLTRRDIVPSEENKVRSDGMIILNEIITVQNNIELNIQQLSTIDKDISILEPWGDFRPENIRRLKNHGLVVRFFIAASSKFDPEWENAYTLEILNHLSGQMYFVIITRDSEPIEIDAEEIRLPEKSLSDLVEERNGIREIINKADEVLDRYAARYIPLLSETRNKIVENISYQKVVLSTTKEAEEKVMLLEGWVPAEIENRLTDFLDNAGIYYMKSLPSADDKVPIKLKNSKFSRLFEPIGELYTLPDYKELDLTPFFAPFFMMFFGFCLGDVGYGLLILVAAIIFRSRVKEPMKSILTLGIFLGIATIIMGTVSGTLFGINLIKADWPWLSGLKHIMLDYNKLMLLSFALGYIQTVFGMFLKAINVARIYGFKQALSNIGWIIVVLGGAIFLGLNKLLGVPFHDMLIPVVIAGSVAGVLIFLLNSPGKNVFLNFGLGIWDTYGMASGLLGDLLSYVRLFALGISSAVLGNVFNQLAFSLSPEIPVIGQLVTLLILLFGHSLNLFMSALGSFVHPLRLTFVEFYRNAGFSGGGKKYNPFRKYITD